MYGKLLICHDSFFLIQFFKYFPDLNLRGCLMCIMPVFFQRLFQCVLIVADKCRIGTAAVPLLSGSDMKMDRASQSKLLPFAERAGMTKGRRESCIHAEPRRPNRIIGNF